MAFCVDRVMFRVDATRVRGRQVGAPTIAPYAKAMTIDAAINVDSDAPAKLSVAPMNAEASQTTVA